MGHHIWPVGQAVKTPPFHGGNTGSSPVRVIFGGLAQLGEHLPYKQRVTGSSPIGPIYRENGFYLCSTPMWLNSRQLRSEASQL